MILRALLSITALIACVATPLRAQEEPAVRGTITVGSKNFTESSVLGEIMAQLIEDRTSLRVDRELNLGGTLICWTALKSGEIDLYADYTGTAWAILLERQEPVESRGQVFLDVVRECRERFGVRWLEPFGLDNTYALAMRDAQAESLGIEKISDLVAHQNDLTGGFSIEFNERQDGLPGLLDAYGLEFGQAKAIEHGFAYDALNDGEIDVMDVYATDGKLPRYDLRLLEDDLSFFPPYNASPVLNGDTARRYPELQGILSELAFQIPDGVARSLNFMVEAEGAPIRRVARAFLELRGFVTPGADPDGVRARLSDLIEGRSDLSTDQQSRTDFFDLLSTKWFDLLVYAAQHLTLTGIAVLLAAAVAIPLGIWITRQPRMREFVLGFAGIVQTIPSLALLAFMIPLLGLDARSAIAALFLYAMLPILRNTYTGLVEVDPDLIDAARGMGMRPREILFRVQLPLASRTILAGVRTSTVISIGVATLAAFIGAGGLGEPIVNGLYLNDTNLILLGAIPAAILAILADRGLGRLETVVAPKGAA